MEFYFYNFASPGGMTEAAHRKAEEIKSYKNIEEIGKTALKKAKELGSK